MIFWIYVGGIIPWILGFFFNKHPCGTWQDIIFLSNNVAHHKLPPIWVVVWGLPVCSSLFFHVVCKLFSCYDHFYVLMYNPGWWFGTWMDYDFPFSWQFHHPNWLSLTPSFFRGVSSNQQPEFITTLSTCLAGFFPFKEGFSCLIEYWQGIFTCSGCQGTSWKRFVVLRFPCRPGYRPSHDGIFVRMAEVHLAEPAAEFPFYSLLMLQNRNSSSLRRWF